VFQSPNQVFLIRSYMFLQSFMLKMLTKSRLQSSWESGINPTYSALLTKVDYELPTSSFVFSNAPAYYFSKAKARKQILPNRIWWSLWSVGPYSVLRWIFSFYYWVRVVRKFLDVNPKLEREKQLLDPAFPVVSWLCRSCDFELLHLPFFFKIQLFIINI
jgi:hypothetical protein